MKSPYCTFGLKLKVMYAEMHNKHKLIKTMNDEDIIILTFQGSWHPIHNLVIIGRYPDKKSPSYQEGENRTIDVIDGSSGEIVCQLLDPNVQPGIVSVSFVSNYLLELHLLKGPICFPFCTGALLKSLKLNRTSRPG